MASFTTAIQTLIETDKDFPKQLKQRLVLESSNVTNPFKFIRGLFTEGVLNDGSSDTEASVGLKEMMVQLAMMLVCSKGADAIGGLKKALEDSGNLQLISNLRTWVKEDFAIETDDDPSEPEGAAAVQQRKEDSESLRSSIFDSAAISSLPAIFQRQQESATDGISLVQFVKEGAMTSSADATLNLWNWRGGEEEPINIEAQVKNFTCFQFDEEVLVFGTTKGTVHLFDARTFEEKSSIAIQGRHPITSLKFLESTLVVITRSSKDEEVFWFDISRPNMQLLNQKYLLSWGSYENQTPGVWISPDATFVYYYQVVYIYDLKPGRRMKERKLASNFLAAPYDISTLNVGDLIGKIRVIVAGCLDGTIVIWKSYDLIEEYKLVKTFKGHTDALVSLCFLNGHLLGLDRSGKLLMWSRQDLENGKGTPVSRVLIEKSNVTSLTSNERWFSSGCSSEDVINIWTLPDLLLR